MSALSVSAFKPFLLLRLVGFGLETAEVDQGYRESEKFFEKKVKERK